MISRAFENVCLLSAIFSILFFFCSAVLKIRCRQTLFPCPLAFIALQQKRADRLLSSASTICQTSGASQVTGAERPLLPPLCRCSLMLQPSRSTEKLQTQAVFWADEQQGDLSVTHRSSGAGDTPGSSGNDPSYTNVSAKLMS